VEEENHDDDDNDTKSSCALSIGVRGNPLKACSVSLLIAFPLDKLRRKINSPSASPSSQDNSANSLTDAVHVCVCVCVCVCEEIMESKSDIVGWLISTIILIFLILHSSVYGLLQPSLNLYAQNRRNFFSPQPDYPTSYINPIAKGVPQIKSRDRMYMYTCMHSPLTPAPPQTWSKASPCPHQSCSREPPLPR
jgi:hypothetical protein